MKHSVLNLLFLLAIGAMSCTKTVDPRQEYTADLKQAKKWFVGQWNLVQVDGMTPNPVVPSVQLIIDNNQVTIIQNGKQIDKVGFEVIKTNYNLQLKTNAQPQAGNWYIGNPALQISKNQMYLDAGRAMDLPGYEFKRLN